MVITSQNAQLDVMVLVDLSSTNPVIQLTNLSTGDPAQSPLQPLDYLTWAFNVISPAGVPIYSSDFDSPFQTGIWTTATITNPWPRPFNQIQWSGADYQFNFSILDNSTGKIYELPKSATICRPKGLGKTDPTMYGFVPLVIETICDKSSLYIQDKTDKTYRGITGQPLSSYLAVDYPRDSTGTLPAPFTITNFNNDALVPITFNGKGYHATYYTIIQYDLGNNVFLKFRYTSQADFNVSCNADVCAVTCQIEGLTNAIATGNCDSVQDAKDKLAIITAKAQVVLMGIKSPSCGIDVYSLIDEIVALGGYECDCASASDGLGSQSTLIDGILYTVAIEGGDITGRFEQTANNITLYLADKSYTFSVCADSDTEAFEFRPSVNGSAKNTCLYVKKTILAQEILNTISTDVNLLNLLNSLVSNSINFLMSVDGACVIQTNPLTNYSWQLNNIPATGTFASLISILNGNTTVPLNYQFNQTNLTQFQNYLNTLNLGVFTVSFSGSTVTINSAANTNNFSNLKYNPGSGATFASQTSTSAGIQQIPAEQIVQAIIYYLCGIDDSKIVTSADYEICYVDADGNKQIQTVAAGVNLTDFVAALNEKNCTTVDYIVKLNSASCDSIKKVFVSSTTPITATDYLLGTRGGNCARISPIEALNYAIKNIDATTLTELCNKIIECGAGKSCQPYDYLEAELNPHDTTCSYIVGIQGSWS